MDIHRHRMVSKISPHHLCEPHPLRRNGLVHPLTQLLLDVPEFSPHAVGTAFAAQHEAATARLAADMGESKECKGFRFSPTAFLPSFCRIAAKLQQAGLLR